MTQEAYNPYHALEALETSYLFKAYDTGSSYKVQQAVRNALPGWELLGVSSYHHKPVMVIQHRETGFIEAVGRGSTPWNFRTIFTGEHWHIWGRNVWKGVAGPTKGGRDFVQELIEKFGSIDAFDAHSAFGHDLDGFKFEGFKFIANGLAPKGGYQSGDLVAVVSHKDSLNKKVFWYLPGQDSRRKGMIAVGSGRHNPMGVAEGFGGIWPDDTWNSIKKGSGPYGSTPAMGPPEPLPRSQYPQPKFQSEPALYDATKARLEEEQYRTWGKAKPHHYNPATNRPKTDYKGAEKIKERVEEALEPSYKGGINMIKADPEYQKELELLREKRKLDNAIARNEKMLVDDVANPCPESASSEAPSVAPVVSPGPGIFDNVAGVFMKYCVLGPIHGLVGATGQLTENLLPAVQGYGLKHVLVTTYHMLSHLRQVWSAPTVSMVSSSVQIRPEDVEPIAFRKLTEQSGAIGDFARMQQERWERGESEEAVAAAEDADVFRVFGYRT